MELENFKHNLRNLKKCDQVWDEMNPVSGGRHCNKCDKKITDFSAMTHAEIALFMTEQDAPVCGYYLPDQLPNYNWKSNSISFSIGFSALFAAINVFNAAATVKQDLPICQTDKSFDRILIINENLSIGKPTDTIFIRGTVQ